MPCPCSLQPSIYPCPVCSWASFVTLSSTLILPASVRPRTSPSLYIFRKILSVVGVASILTPSAGVLHNMATAVMPRCLVTIHACDGDPLSPTRDHVTTLMQCLCTQVAIHPRGQVSVLVNKCDFLSLGEVASSCGSRRVASAVKPRHLRLRHDHLCCQRCLVVACIFGRKM